MELARVLMSWNVTLVGTVRKNKKFLPRNMQPTKERPVYSTNFANHRDATVCSYVSKKMKAIVLLLSMNMSGEIAETLSAKSEIINYYNKTKGRVNTLDKMLSEHTVKRKTLRWPLAFIYKMIDVTGKERYIIHRGHNPSFRKKDQRRKFLKERANMLCLSLIEACSNSRMLMRNHFLGGAAEMLLGRRIVAQPENAVVARAPHGSRGSTSIVGSCCVCRDQIGKQHKTTKSCVVCRKPVCNEYLVSKTMCIFYEND